MTTETVYPTETATPTVNLAGRASLILAFVIVAVGIGEQVVSQSVPLIMQAANLDATTIGLIFSVFGAVVGLLAIVGLILGIIGLGRPVGRAAAGAGTAIAASSLLTVLVGFLLPLLLNALY